MQFIHTQKFIRTAPRKFSDIAQMVRGMDPYEAIELLPHTEKLASEPLVKVLKTAVANANQAKVTGKLMIKELQITSGPSLKRGRAVSRGQHHPYKRRMSHVRVVLETVEVLKEVKVLKKPKTSEAKKTIESKKVVSKIKKVEKVEKDKKSK